MLSRRPLFLCLLCAAGVAGGFAGNAAWAAPTPATPAPRLGEMRSNLFDDTTGQRLAQIRVERVGVGYGRQGFLRVAWRPHAVLEGVRIEVAPGATWPATGMQIRRALRSHGAGDPVLRSVTLVFADGSGRTVTAEQAQLIGDERLELTGAIVAGDAAAGAEPANLNFWLTGPRAGTWEPLAASAPPLSRRVSPPASASPVR